MKYSFFGTPEFAGIILEKLIEAGIPPAMVVCNPDRPVGRKKIITPPPTKIIAEKHGIPVSQPEKIDDQEISKHRSMQFGVVAAYAKILPKKLIESFPKGMIGAHPSLLPKYRGATPIQSVILAGEEKTGTTLFLLDEKVDHGPVLAQVKLPAVAGKKYKELEKELAELSGNLLVQTLPKFSNGEIGPKEQDHEKATLTKKFKTEDAYVDLEKDEPIIIERKIRALNPEPGVYTIKNGKRVKLLEAKIKDGKLALIRVQEEGGKPRSA